MSRLQWINLVLFQLSWFALVLGAANDMIWPGALLIAILVMIHSRGTRFQSVDLKIVGVSVLIGLIVDTVWVRSGIMQFAAPWPVAGLAPAWIVLLWVGFALTLPHSLAWLSHRYGLAALMGGVASPMSYWAGMRFGAVEFPQSFIAAMIAAGVSWALLMPFLIWLVDYWTEKTELSAKLRDGLAEGRSS